MYPDYRDGKPVIVEIESAAGAGADVTTDVRPGENIEWLVLMMWTLNDAAAGVTCNWQFTDGTSTIEEATASINGNSMLNMYAPASDAAGRNGVGSGLPIKLTRNFYAQVKAASLPAGKKVYIRGVVLARYGVA